MTILWNLKSVPSNLSNCKIRQKKKPLDLWRKMLYLGILIKNVLFGHFWDRRLKILLPYLKPALPNLSVCKTSQKKSLNLRPKMPYLGIFGKKCLIWAFLGKNCEKNYCYIWNQHPQMCIVGQLHEKTNMPKFGTQNEWFGNF